MASSPISVASMFLADSQSAKNTASTQAKAAAAGTTSTKAGTGLDSTTTGTTFLNLLVKELQNQDPTSPMDSTAMVGQMISLNSLDQLISINQTLSSATTSKNGSAVTGVVGADATSSSAAQMAQRAELMNNTQSANAMQAALDPTKALDLSTLNFANGGK